MSGKGSGRKRWESFKAFLFSWYELDFSSYLTIQLRQSIRLYGSPIKVRFCSICNNEINRSFSQNGVDKIFIYLWIYGNYCAQCFAWRYCLTRWSSFAANGLNCEREKLSDDCKRREAHFKAYKEKIAKAKWLIMEQPVLGEYVEEKCVRQLVVRGFMLLIKKLTSSGNISS